MARQRLLFCLPRVHPRSPGVDTSGAVSAAFAGGGLTPGVFRGCWSAVRCRRRRGLLADPDRYPRAAGRRLKTRKGMSRVVIVVRVVAGVLLLAHGLGHLLYLGPAVPGGSLRAVG